MGLKETLINIEKAKYFILKKIGSNLPNKLFKANCRGYEFIDEHNITYRRKPKDSNLFITMESKCDEQKMVGIIIQGQVLLTDDFTLNNVKYYKKMYPYASIIVSTWDTTDDKVCEILKKVGAIVVLSRDPDITGIGNVNRQLVTTNAGIKKCKELGLPYILKTRTDQRICKLYFLEYFLSLINTFSSNADSIGLLQERRIVAFQATVGSSMFIPYMLSDMLFFGTTQDIEEYFSFPFSDVDHKTRANRWNYGKKLLDNNVSIYEYYSKMAPEMMLAWNYAMTASNGKLSNTLQDYWKFLKECMICISVDDVELYWPKYNCYEESLNYHLYEDNDDEGKLLRYNWGFGNWLSLYNGLIKYDLKYEMHKNVSCKEVIGGT